MTLASFITDLLRGLIPVVAGYTLARWGGLTSQSLHGIMRFVFLPALLFWSLTGNLGQRTFIMLAGTGVTMGLAGFFLVRLLGSLQKNKSQLLISPAAARPNILVFVLTFVAISWHFKMSGIMAVAILFIAVSITLLFCEFGENGFKVIIREPWFYAVLLVLIFKLAHLKTGSLVGVLSPLKQGAAPLLLVYLGTLLHPWAGFKAKGAWMGVGVRLVTGLAIAVLAVLILPLPAVRSGDTFVKWAIILAGIAPASSMMGSLMCSRKETTDERSLATVSIVVSFALMVGWRIFVY